MFLVELSLAQKREPYRLADSRLQGPFMSGRSLSPPFQGKRRY